MFTGIISSIGTVKALKRSDEGMRLTMMVDFPLDDVVLGASISHAGCCLTVVKKGEGVYDLDVSNETLSLTNLSEWRVGTQVNLERALKIGDELGGHIVSGHIDGLAKLISVTPDGESYRLTFEAPAPLHRFIAPKGSVALDGISLTVNEVEGQTFGVNIIPHTWTHTTLSQTGVGGHVNLEVDRLARYAARWYETKALS
ncbi:riboflavin synthase [Asticcacaulis sp. EMRT-3]|uniref:riboflavin synthase n=1 Tax=Asticcacaulis sp. EMRT-3 TaxID=3040349 RepID=UPI0024AFFD66|nr:riboflavin synthase [Asticcacaulis sp. EMRT-3]MDI7774403.1 riboflavin synthase [Asticcacaulis sp. EMRT-3]